MRKKVTARGNGRVELLGNHTDYNQGLVLCMTADKGTVATVRTRSDSRLHFSSTGYQDVSLDLGALQLKPGQIRDLLPADTTWARYPMGVLKQAYDERLVNPQSGLDFSFVSDNDFPHGAGMSASAAIETSTYMALKELFDFEDTIQWAVHNCQMAEHGVVGGSCGDMDQMSSMNGGVQLYDTMLKVVTPLVLPAGLELLVFDTRVKHQIAPHEKGIESAYQNRQRQCFDAASKMSVGSLKKVTTHDLQKALSQGTINDIEYLRASHITAENDRVSNARELFSYDVNAGYFVAGMQTLMDASHASSSVFFENSCPQLDLLHAAIQQVHGYRGRLTGGGFGGGYIVPVIKGTEIDLHTVQLVYGALAEHKGVKVEELKLIRVSPGIGAYHQFS